MPLPDDTERRQYRIGGSVLELRGPDGSCRRW
jgi:hypothetical protein